MRVAARRRGAPGWTLPVTTVTALIESVGVTTLTSEETVCAPTVIATRTNWQASDLGLSVWITSVVFVAARDDPAALLGRLQRGRPGRVRHVEQLPARVGATAPWPDWVEPSVLASLTGSGIAAPWRHQREAMDLARAGAHVVLATGTASGKSLGYLVPVLTDLVDGANAASGRGATGIYLAPTKALAADQLARIESMAVPSLRAATYDGDTSPDERRWVREHAQLVLTNPDLLHHSLLPGHDRWRPFLRALRWVVIDECHMYRGVFGAHVAAVLRRLRRVAARYGATPQFILASATVSAPALHAGRLCGVPVQPVTVDSSPREALTFALWEPESIDGTRRSATTESADLLADLVDSGVQTLAFARSRAGAEALATRANRIVTDRGGIRDAVAAYRGGYLAEDRRALERSLRSGTLHGLAATNALELGVDISGLDAVVMAGWPGRRASLWQQAGRAGRAGRPALAILVAADDPLDTFVMAHPEAVFGVPVEETVMDPDNPHVLAPHLAAAAAELPLTETDFALFGPQTERLIGALVAGKVLRRRPNGWFWARADRASDHVSLRGVGDTVAIVDGRSGRVLGTVDEASAHVHVHTGAVHLHQGETWVVTELDLGAASASVVRGDPGWSTTAQSRSTFDIVRPLRMLPLAPARGVTAAFGQVRVSTQVTGFLRRLPSGEVLGQHPLDLPERVLTTTAVWWTLTPEILQGLGVPAAHVPGALHAAEHAAIGLLPLIATCDRWDIGGVSTALHPDTGEPTIMVYDGYPGGAGFAERAFDALPQWLTATAEAIAQCPCERGCPSCVQSPKCGNGNEPLDKAGAVLVLRGTLAALAGNVPASGPVASVASGTGTPTPLASGTGIPASVAPQ
ncbi:MAG: DEAD/DEAH box helicase [Phycicoccus sp.]|nr:DEAD/DEAH box helicase [Phycicoccus sp.]